MSLHNGLDTVSIISFGIWSKTFHFAHPLNRANLYSSFGYLEDAPTTDTSSLTAWIKKVKDWFWELY